MSWSPSTTADRLGHHLHRCDCGFLVSVMYDDAERTLRASLDTGVIFQVKGQALSSKTSSDTTTRAQPLRHRPLEEKKPASLALSFVAKQAEQIADHEYLAEDALSIETPTKHSDVLLLPHPRQMLGMQPAHALVRLREALPAITDIAQIGSVDWPLYAHGWSTVVAHTRMVYGDWSSQLASAQISLGGAMLMLRQPALAEEYSQAAINIQKKLDAKTAASVVQVRARILKAAAKLLSHPTDPLTGSLAVRKAASSLICLQQNATESLAATDAAVATRRSLECITDTLMSIAECQRGAGVASSSEMSDRAVVVYVSMSSYLITALKSSFSALSSEPIAALRERVKARLLAAKTESQRNEVSALVSADALTVKIEAEALALRIDRDSAVCCTVIGDLVHSLRECCVRAEIFTGPTPITSAPVAIQDGSKRFWVANKSFICSATHALFGLARGAWIGERWNAAASTLRACCLLYDLLIGKKSVLVAAARESLALVLLRREMRSIDFSMGSVRTELDEMSSGPLLPQEADKITFICSDLLAQLEREEPESAGTDSSTASDVSETSPTKSSVKKKKKLVAGACLNDDNAARTSESFQLLDSAVRANYGAGRASLHRLAALFESLRECCAISVDVQSALVVNAGYASTLVALVGISDPRATAALRRFSGLTGKVHAPLFSPCWGVVSLLSELKLSTATEGAQIYFSLSGYPAPGERETVVYTNPIVFNKVGHITVRAISVKDERRSGVVEASFSVVLPSGKF